MGVTASRAQRWVFLGSLECFNVSWSGASRRVARPPPAQRVRVRAGAQKRGCPAVAAASSSPERPHHNTRNHNTRSP